MRLILVRQRKKSLRIRNKKKSRQTLKVILNQVNNEEEQAWNNIEEAERIELPREEITEEDQDLKAMFITQLENLIHSSLLQMESREKLRKVRFDNQLKESANRILDIYLKEADTNPEICDKVYAMEKQLVSNWANL